MPVREILKAADDPVPLYTRAETRRQLKVSIDTIRRMERAGILTPIRLTGRPQSWVHHRKDQVDALLKGGRS